MADKYYIDCWHCLGEYDVMSAGWCNHHNPTKICPYCLNCSCDAPESYKKRFWEGAPRQLKLERVKLVSAKEKLGEILIAERKISSEQLVAALNIQEKTQEKIGRILVKMGLISEEELNIYLIRQQKVPTVDIEKESIDLKLIKKIGIENCLKHRILPFLFEEIREDKNRLHIAMENPYNPRLIRKVGELFGSEIVYYQADSEKLRKKIEEIFKSIKIRSVTPATGNQKSLKEFLKILNYSIDKGADYLYLHQDFSKIDLKLRINGMLYRIKNLRETDLQNKKDFIEKLKDILGVNKNNRLIKKSIDRNNKKYVIHILEEPSSERLGFNIRIYNLQEFGKDLDSIGLSEYDLNYIQEALNKKNGIIAVSAPLFNESSSLIYSLMEFVKDKPNVASMEKRIVRKVENLNQKIYSDKYSEEFVDFIYRENPEIVFVHSLRNADLAKEIFDLSLKSLFIVEMYANSSGRTINQFKNNFYVNPEDIAEKLNLIVNQRMVRVLCEKCKIRIKPTMNLLSSFNIPEEDSSFIDFYKENGCKFCNFTGFERRTPIFEVLKVDDDIKKGIRDGVSLSRFRELMISEGIIPLSKNVQAMIQNGLTSATELKRQGFI